MRPFRSSAALEVTWLVLTVLFHQLIQHDKVSVAGELVIAE